MKIAHFVLAGAAVAVSIASAHAADLLKPDPIYDSPLFNFEGLYIGGSVGGALTTSLYGTAGVIVGSNFQVTDGIIVGGEFQGDVYFNGGLAAYDALALGRVGGFISDNTMIYGDVGLGIVNTTPVYAIGGGAEMALGGQSQRARRPAGAGRLGLVPLGDPRHCRSALARRLTPPIPRSSHARKALLRQGLFVCRGTNRSGSLRFSFP